MKQFLLATLLISAVFAAPAVEETEIQPAQFMNPMMMNPMMMMRNPMMMMRNPMMMGMMMGSGCGSCSCMPRCTVIWMCPPVCNPCCCDNTCDNNNDTNLVEIEEDPEPEILPMPLPIFPNYPLLDEIAQRLLEKPVAQYPPDIIVSRPRH